MASSPILTPEQQSALMHSCTFSFEFRKPECKHDSDSCFYRNAFKKSISSVESFDFVTALDASRNAFIECINTPHSEENLMRMLVCAEIYIKNLLSLLHSLTNQSPVEIDGPLIFSWRGSITPSHESSSFREIVFELVMVYHTKVECVVNGDSLLLFQEFNLF